MTTPMLLDSFVFRPLTPSSQFTRGSKFRSVFVSLEHRSQTMFTVNLEQVIRQKHLSCQVTCKFSTKPSVHFVGIGGSGLSALASLALQQGWEVSGSDAISTKVTHALKEAGARVYIGHAAQQLLHENDVVPDAVVVSSAVPSENEEVIAARAFGIPIYKRGEWLERITENYEVLAVAGSHGKSTTTAMLSIVLKDLQHDVTAIVGAEVPQFPGGGNVMYGRGQRFVLEADEYDGCFLHISPSVAIVTSIDWEHVDMFPDEASVTHIFRQFAQRVKPRGTLLVCGDSAGSLLGSTFRSDEKESSGNTKTEYSRELVTYGMKDGNDWQALMISPDPQCGTDYVVVHRSRLMARVSLQLPGTHNVLNSLAVIVVTSLLAAQDSNSVDPDETFSVMRAAAEAASRVLSQFGGIRRRFELVAKVKGCFIYDDYAHHPTEVGAVLQAARQRFDQKPIWVVFQPHTYSRLAKLLHDFARAFSSANRVIVTEVYPAREKNMWDISGADLAKIIIGPPAVFVPALDKVVEILSRELAQHESMGLGDVVLLTLGAGDVTNVGYDLLNVLRGS